MKFSKKLLQKSGKAITASPGAHIQITEGTFIVDNPIILDTRDVMKNTADFNFVKQKIDQVRDNREELNRLLQTARSRTADLARSS